MPQKCRPFRWRRRARRRSVAVAGVISLSLSSRSLAGGSHAAKKTWGLAAAPSSSSSLPPTSTSSPVCRWSELPSSTTTNQCKIWSHYLIPVAIAVSSILHRRSPHRRVKEESISRSVLIYWYDSQVVMIRECLKIQITANPVYISLPVSMVSCYTTSISAK